MPLFNDFFPSHVVAFTGDGRADFTLANGRPDFTDEQFKYLTSRIDGSLPAMAQIRQAHGDRVIIAGRQHPSDSRALPEADGLITDARGLALIVRTADCLPVFLYDQHNECIGLVHSGWRGTEKNILVKAVMKMNRTWVSEIKNIKAYFGPAIRACCYEVGAEFKDHFPDDLIERDGKYYLDLPGINRSRLLRLGIKEDHIGDCGICTCCDRNYFSHRRDGSAAGRMISMLYIKQ